MNIRVRLGLMWSAAALLALSANALSLKPLGQYKHGGFKTSAAEIAAYDSTSQRLFVVNGEAKRIDVLDLRDPNALKFVGSVPLDGGAPNSVAIRNGIGAAALDGKSKQGPGQVVLFDPATLKTHATLATGAMPDMVTITADGRWVLTANEGEPDQKYNVDPEGSVSIIDLANGPQAASVRTIGFAGFGYDDGMKPIKKGQSFQQDAEPEYVATSSDSKTAWVVLQEVNAMAVLDIEAGKFTKVKGLGFKDWSKLEMDASDRDGEALMKSWPVWGVYQPDSIMSYQVDGKTFIISANEGDTRDFADFGGYTEETRIKDLKLDPTAFPNANSLQGDANIGRLKSFTSIGDTDGDGDHDRLFALGARSISIWSADVELVADTGDTLERELISYAGTKGFNANHEENGADLRSDDKGPEPEGLAIATLGGRTYAFVGLERVGGVFTFDVTDPANPTPVDYTTTRDFTKSPALPAGGDAGPEGVLYIAPEQSPNGKPLLVVANEVSSTTRVFEIVLD